MNNDELNNVPFLHYNISARGIEGDARAALDMIKAKEKQKVVDTINAHSTCVAQDDKQFREALQKANLLIPDGQSVVLAARLLGHHVPQRVSGYDFFQKVSTIADEEGGISVFFLGSSEEVLEKISTRLSKEYPNIRIAGTLSPPFKPEFTEEDNIALCAKVTEAKPDILWVGLTAPKQEKWIEGNKDRLDVGFSAAIGAVFDFYAGTKKRAPVWAQKWGLEWAHRFCSEPKRVWQRYLINNPRFVWLVLKNKAQSK